MAKAAANSGAKVETEPSISPASPGCTYCRRKIRRAVSSSSARALEDLLLELVGQALVLDLRLGELDQQLAHRRVTRGLGGLAVKRGFELHVFGEFAHLVEVERLHQPERLLLDEL